VSWYPEQAIDNIPVDASDFHFRFITNTKPLSSSPFCGLPSASHWSESSLSSLSLTVSAGLRHFLIPEQKIKLGALPTGSRKPIMYIEQYKKVYTQHLTYLTQNQHKTRFSCALHPPPPGGPCGRIDSNSLKPKCSQQFCSDYCLQ